MSEPALRDATYEDLLHVPGHLVAELIDRELFTSPRPASPHALASSVLGAKLGSSFHYGGGDGGGWWIIDEPELHLGRDVLVPDLAGWRRTRMPFFPEVPWFDVAPDWVCEIVSASTARLDRLRKMPKYAANGIEYAWLVDPLLQLLDAFRLHEGKWVLLGSFGGEQKVRIEPFDAIEIDLTHAWIERPPA